MILTLGHLPSEVNEQDVLSLLAYYSEVRDVRFLGNERHREAQVTLNEESRVGMSLIVDRLNGHYWRDRRISAHYFLFQ